MNKSSGAIQFLFEYNLLDKLTFFQQNQIYIPFKEVNLSYTLRSGRSSFLVDLTNTELIQSPHSICLEDVYVCADTTGEDPNNNNSYWTNTILQVGCHSAYLPEPTWESYFLFDLSNVTEDFNKLEIRISLKIPDGLNPYNFSMDVYLIEEEWDQVHMRWLTRPNKSDYITTLTQDNIISEHYDNWDHDFLLIDIEEYSNRDNISICLTPSLDRMDEDNHVYLWSREYFFDPYKPRVIWN